MIEEGGVTDKQPTGLVVGALRANRAAVSELHQRCNAADGIDTPLFLDPNPGVSGTETEFGFYERGALAGFAFLPDDPEPEASLFVHPDARRCGIGRALLDAVRAESRRRGLTTFILVTDAASASGQAFLTAMGARYRTSEYRLALNPERIDRSRQRHAGLVLRPAEASDLETLTRVMAAAFGDDEAEVRDRVVRGLAERNRHYCLAMLGQEAIGVIRIGEWEGAGDITSFGVLPTHQGRGYGRQILLDATDILLNEGWSRIMIEVATDNDHALGLYRSCGFEVVAKYDYYDLAA
jgi:ribosomal protein S18 acetylase RimI-like enzyme